MSATSPPGSLELPVRRLFELVCEAIAGATAALLGGEPSVGRTIVEADVRIDELTAELEQLVWARIDAGLPSPEELRALVSVLLMLPELERSADLAEHVAQRAASNLGPAMTPRSRGLVQRMSDVAVEMWHAVAIAYSERAPQAASLDEADEELDILHERLTTEVASAEMPAPVAAQVTLLARFYERLGDHAVNLARRVESLPGVGLPTAPAGAGSPTARAARPDRA